MPNDKYQIVTTGSLYLNGVPKAPDGFDYDGASTISIGDKVSGMEISWVKPADMELLVSTSVIMCNVSWCDLNDYGFVKGKLVTIDGKEYLCRLVRAPASVGQKDEWASILLSTFCEHIPWDTKPYSFWTDFRHHVTYNTGRTYDYAVLRGGDAIRTEMDAEVRLRSPGVGFRPVLEPIQTGNHAALDGHHFLISLPTGGEMDGDIWMSEWNRAIAADVSQRALNSKGKKKRPGFEWLGLFSICKETSKGNVHRAICRGGLSANEWGTVFKDTVEQAGFRPKIVPVWETSGKYFFNDAPFSNISNGTVLRMYTLCQDGEPVKIIPGSSCVEFREGAKLEITDQYFGEEYLIPWVFFDGKAIAQKNLLCKISWNDLYGQGYC